MIKMNTENIIAYIIKIFDLNSIFVVKKYNENNNKSYEKIIKCLLFNDFYKDSYLVSDELKKFIYNSLFKKESLILLDNENSITEFILAYNYFRGYIEFKKCYESHKFNYIQVMGIKNNKFLFVSIKSEIIDKNKTYIVVNKDLYDSVMDNYDLYDGFKEFKLDIFNNCLIKDNKLKPSKPYKLSLESLIDIFYSYKKSIKIDNEIYTLKNNEYDNDSYLRYLVSDYYDYYATKNSLNEFYEYLTDYKGLNLDLTLNEWFNLKNTYSNERIIDMVYYNQVIKYLETFKGYDNRLKQTKQLRDNKLRYDTNVIKLIWYNTNVYKPLNQFLKDNNLIREFY